uniref:Uncharacterized protein n=1 Tax=Ditylenchus dipsaci TaxID=166011 RepID=A0A915CYG7_9BILA
MWRILWFLPVASQIPHVLLCGLLLASAVPFRFQRLSGFLFHTVAGVVSLLAPFLIYSPAVIGTFDSVHFFLQRFLGAFHLAINFAKAIAAAFMLITQLLGAYQVYETKARGLLISPNFLSCALLVDGAWFAVEVYRLIHQKYTVADEIDIMCKRTQRWVEGRTSRDAQVVLWVDAAAMLTYAFFNFAYPEPILKASIRREYPINDMHMLFSRQFACHALVPALISFVASHFTVKHQKSYIMQRILTQSLVFLLHCYGHFILGVYNAAHLGPFLVSGFYIALLVSIYVRVHHEEMADIAFDEANGPNQQTSFTTKKEPPGAGSNSCNVFHC